MADFRVLPLATDELVCIFETHTGFLRKIVHGETEIVRAIYAAVRDENWNTVEPGIEIRNVRVEQNKFRVDFDALCQAAGVDLRLSSDPWVNEYRLAVEEAAAIGARLQAALFVSDNALQELGQFRNMMDPAIIDSCLIFHEKEVSTSERWLLMAQELLHGVQIVAGTNAYFAELNRNRPPKGFPAAYSINPQVHAFDDRSLMENLEAQPATVESARQFCEHGVVLSPITLRPRFNPNATTKTIEPEGQLPGTVDRRQRTMVGACWMAGSLAALLPCEAVVSLTYFETTGWRGLMETDLGSPLPAKFDSSPDEIFPLYYVLEFVAGASSVLRLGKALSDCVSVLGLRDRDASTRYLLANLEAVSKRIRFRSAAKAIELSILSETNLDTLRKGTLPEAKHLSISGEALDFDFPAMSLALIWLKP